ncbi:glycerol-3-phosphate acyltransferase [Capsaspora owczarzaki ATCC 30864]|uniref:Glycerol-3-phosphate acyltransferase n=1 Tax=Capsaspora owczarzaki (strain ATCC 30864) TaxID=595528 RepID=A0A0D2VM91_CAPO3|nr:glycerol-3-phosphate acyltransferase [Capsaspora owczarzaki ATCC 30864]KJE91262.1 glycerol-3-phosphate acyltransferase [Capsaspora owczarzaki ATCC 30864]|eukprot:XP_004349172.2 glycerol-3-phosphate acyltransferase [Capsaspora owczarzaki ATCC 30864]
MGLLVWFFNVCLRIFFRDVEVIGSHNIPADGPVIFVANHNNQFVDGLLLGQSVGTRVVRFLIAEKSYKRKVVGKFARAMNSIPVARAQDNASTGSGLLTLSADGLVVYGSQTSFVATVKPGDALKFNHLENEFRVASVVSDTELTLAKAVNGVEIQNQSGWKIMRKVDQGVVYKSVWNTLLSGECVGIFPEGGSHDRTDLLPIKAGVAIMALGAMEAHPEMQPVRIVPCGLNYFHAHRFRSRVLVEFGPPIVVDADLVARYKTDKRGATGDLLGRIEASLRGTVMNTTDYKTMVALHTARRMYTPANVQLTPEQYTELNKRFAMADQKLTASEEYQALKTQMLTYNDTLRSYGVRDKDVQTIQQSHWFVAFWLFWGKLLLAGLFFLLSGPGMLLALPVGAVADNIAKKKAIEAKAASDVKIKGLDVLATWKLMTALIVGPVALSVYVAAIAILVALLTDLPIWAKVVIPVGSVIVLPFWLFYSVALAGVAIRLWVGLRPLFFTFCTSKKHRTLKQMRMELQRKVKELIEVLAPQLIENFSESRIVKIDSESDEQREPEEETLDSRDPSGAAAAGVAAQASTAQLMINEP